MEAVKRQVPRLLPTLYLLKCVEKLSEKGHEQRSEGEFGRVGRQKWTEK
jgi:hypothetical protein